MNLPVVAEFGPVWMLVVLIGAAGMYGAGYAWKRYVNGRFEEWLQFLRSGKKVEARGSVHHNLLCWSLFVGTWAGMGWLGYAIPVKIEAAQQREAKLIQARTEEARALTALAEALSGYSRTGRK